MSNIDEVQVTNHPQIAGAPISWGLCEVPGWGYQMSTERILSEMSALGLAGTEFGPPGFLPQDPIEARDLLASYNLPLLGGFNAVVLHQGGPDAVFARIRSEVLRIKSAGGRFLVLAAGTGTDGYENRPELSRDDWRRMRENLRAVSHRVYYSLGLTVVLHPHLGTQVQTPGEIAEVINDVLLCLDTGHVLAGGGDPLALASEYPERIGLVHAKDADVTVAEALHSGRLSYMDAINNGLFRPIGDGQVPFDKLVTALIRGGYDGPYVLEQDIRLAEEPPVSGGPQLLVQRSRDRLIKYFQ